MSLPDTPSAPPNAQVPKRKKSRLTLYIGIAIVAAVGLAVTAPQVAVQFELGGEIFLRLLLMMVVPLVVASVMSGIIGLGDIRKLGRPGGFAIAYYLTTTVMAVIVGLIMVNIIQPGIGAIDADTLETMAAQGQEITAGREDEGLGSILSNLALMLFTDNLFLAAAESSLVSSAGRPEPIRHRRDTVLLEQVVQPLATVDREEDRSSSIVTTLDGELVVETSGHGSATGPGAEGEAATL